MSIGKKIVGTFNSEQEVMYAIEGLKRQGHREIDMMVVAENRSDIPLVTSRTGVMVEADIQVNSLAGVMMDSFFTMMTAGMVGGSANTNTLSNRLIERGLPEFTAKQCEVEINKGKLILVVDTNRAYDNPVYDYTKQAKYDYDYTKEVKYENQESRAVQLHEEQLDITKERVQVGELQLHKEVVEEQRIVHVPYMREEVYVERRPVIDGKYDGSLITEDEVIRIPITEERIEVTKRPVVVEEIIVGKRRIQETKQVQDIVRKEEARIERSVPWRKGSRMTVREEVFTESPNILIVEGNSDIASEVTAVADKKEETGAKRTGSLAVQGEKNKTESSASKQDEASGKLTDSPDKDASKSKTILAASSKNEAALSNEKSSSAEENKNNNSQMRKQKK